MFIELQVQYMKIPSSNLGRTCCVQKLFLTFRKFFVHCSPHVLQKEELLTKIYLYSGHLEVCKLIMENITDKNPANTVTERNMDEGETPFHFAAKKGHLAVCQLFLDNLSDKNPASKISGLTPLHHAAESGHLEVCKVIMENVVDKNPMAPNWLYPTPLSRAQDKGKKEVCQLFYDIMNNGKCFYGSSA